MGKIHSVAFLVCVLVEYVCCADVGSVDVELTDICADVNLDIFYSDYSDILNSLYRHPPSNLLQENQTPADSCALEAPVLSNTLDSVGINEGSSFSFSLSSPSTSTSTITSVCSAISSAQGCSTAKNAKRVFDRTEKKVRAQNMAKKQKKKTTAAEANSGLMDGPKVCQAVQRFKIYFGERARIWTFLPMHIEEFVRDLAQRGLTSSYSKKIMKLCMASEPWVGHKVFWRMLAFFMDTLSLEVAGLNQLEDKKTAVIRDRIRDKPLSEYSRQHICKAIAKFQEAERMEIECSLSILEGIGTTDVLAILRWLLYHVNIQCAGIACDLREVAMNSKVFGRQVAALTNAWRGNRLCIDSLTLYFTLAEYNDAAGIVKECSSIPVLKMHFIAADLCQVNDGKKALEALLLHCPALKQLSIFGLVIGIDSMQIITTMLPQLVLLEVEFLSLIFGLVLSQKEERESGRKNIAPEFLSLSTLKILKLYNFSGISAKQIVDLFPNLKCMQIPAKCIGISVIDALSSLRFLRSLELINGLLPVETAEYMLDKLPTLECLSVGVKDLDNSLAHALSKCAGMHTLNLRGIYTTGFLASLLQPSPLMCTLKVLCVYRYSRCVLDTLSPRDTYSKESAMAKFGCEVQVKRKS
ncbi:hypothetical protein NECID01_1162 [Nematocida sp. AWRm77]|nr:hypothetical protein NECID01_1162 [Nematocida sp. AWRm77]